VIQFAAIRSHRWRAAALLIWLTTCYGCGDGAPPVSASSEEATVHGVVTIDGKPASGGTIVFKSANISRPSAPDVSAEIEKNGNYTIKTFVGENQIRFQPPAAEKGRYAVDVFDVKSGDNTHDVALGKL
jgi:hypothetical protein